jgi:hypothetical protein
MTDARGHADDDPGRALTNAIGDLMAAMDHVHKRAEEILSKLPNGERKAMVRVLSKLVEIRPDVSQLWERRSSSRRSSRTLAGLGKAHSQLGSYFRAHPTSSHHVTDGLGQGHRVNARTVRPVLCTSRVEDARRVPEQENRTEAHEQHPYDPKDTKRVHPNGVDDALSFGAVVADMIPVPDIEPIRSRHSKRS